MATIRDIAKQAGVSVGTISNFLNNPDLVKDETRARIQQAIDKVGYHPQEAARNLKSRIIKRIGIVPDTPSDLNDVSDPGDAAFQDFLSAVNLIGAKKEYSILMKASIDHKNELDIYRKLLGEGQVDGVLLLGTTPNDKRVKFLLEENYPFVSFGRTQIDGHDNWVDIDGDYGMKLAVDHLVSLGHQKIAWIPTPEILNCFSDRKNGFEKAMKTHGLDIPKEYQVPGGFREQHGQIAMHLLLDLPDPPTAVIAANDICAFGAMNAIAQRNLITGKDVSVIGFDDIRISSHWTPPLTTVRQSMREIGRSSMELLINSIEGNPVESCLIKPELIVRSSVGKI